MFKNSPNYLIIFLFSASAVSANTTCLHPIIKEKVKFYMHPLPSQTCITQIEKRDHKPTNLKSVEDICRDKGLITKSQLEEVLLAKNEPTIECNLIHGTLNNCSTPWGGKVYAEKSRSGTPENFKLLGFIDKKGRLIKLLPERTIWHYPSPKVYNGRYLLNSAGTWTGSCQLFKSKLEVNKFLIYESNFTVKKGRYKIDKDYGWYGAYKKQYVMFGEDKYREKDKIKGDF